MLPAHGSSAQQESGKDSCTHGRLCSQVLCSQSAILGQPAPPGEGKTLSLSTMRVRSISNCFPSRAVVPPVLSFLRQAVRLCLPSLPRRPRRGCRLLRASHAAIVSAGVHLTSAEQSQGGLFSKGRLPPSSRSCHRSQQVARVTTL